MPPAKKLTRRALQTEFTLKKREAKQAMDDIYKLSGEEHTDEARSYFRRLVEGGLDGYAYLREHGDFPPRGWSPSGGAAAGSSASSSDDEVPRAKTSSVSRPAKRSARAPADVSAATRPLRKPSRSVTFNAPRRTADSRTENSSRSTRDYVDLHDSAASDDAPPPAKKPALLPRRKKSVRSAAVAAAAKIANPKESRGESDDESDHAAASSQSAGSTGAAAQSAGSTGKAKGGKKKSAPKKAAQRRAKNKKKTKAVSE